MLYVSVLTTTIYVRSLRYLAQRFGSCGTIYPKINRDGFEKVLSKEIEKLGWARFQEAPNFLKHADKDPDGKMEVDDIHARTGIGLGIILYQRVTDTPPSPEMQAWETIMTLESPDIWDSKPDPEHESYASFAVYVEAYQEATREQRLAMGREFLDGFRSIEKGRPNHF